MTEGKAGRVVVVTGTSTDVGKTIVTAALASVSAARGEQVVVTKPVQTGTDRGDGTADLESSGHVGWRWLVASVDVV